MKRTLMFILMLFIAAGASAAPGRRGPAPGDGPRRGPGVLPPAALADFLDLTEAQKSQIAELRQNEKSVILPLREKLRANREQVKDAIEAGNADKAGELMLANHALREQIKAAHESFKGSVEALLTAPQKAKWAVYEEILDLRREHRRRRG